MRRIVLFCLPLGLLTLGLLLAADPWTAKDLVSPETLSKDVKGPLIIHVGFDVLYRAAHIAGTPYAGPASKPEGIEALKTAVASLAKDADIVIYCGCCPMLKCPNIRPAYRTLKELGFTHVRVLSLPTNLHSDWVEKDYPSEGSPSSN